MSKAINNIVLRQCNMLTDNLHFKSEEKYAKTFSNSMLAHLQVS